MTYGSTILFICTILSSTAGCSTVSSDHRASFLPFALLGDGGNFSGYGFQVHTIRPLTFGASMALHRTVQEDLDSPYRPSVGPSNQTGKEEVRGAGFLLGLNYGISDAIYAYGVAGPVWNRRYQESVDQTGLIRPPSYLTGGDRAIELAMQIGLFARLRLLPRDSSIMAGAGVMFGGEPFDYEGVLFSIGFSW